MIIADPKFAEIRYVLRNLSDRSREDVLSCEVQSPDQMADGIFRSRSAGFTWCFYREGVPAALLGARHQYGGVWSLFGMGTDHWKSVCRLVTLVSKRDMMQAVKAAGAQRAHCLSPSHHHDTHKWLRYLGATHEAAMPKYGANGEDFTLFAWVKE